MSGIRSDGQRDPQTIVQLGKIAERIFHRHGISFATGRRAGGWSNFTWVAGGLVLRLSFQRGTQTMRREAQLASLLPPEVGYPPIVDRGVFDGYEWCLSKEIPGRNLGKIWPQLDWDQRVATLRQLWAKVEAVHTVDVVAASNFVPTNSLFYPANPQDAEVGLTRLFDRQILSAHQVEVLREALTHFWKALPEATFVLNHGDFTIENALWYEDRVVSLMDFEYAVIAPDELDVNELVKMAFAPGEMDDPLPDPRKAGLERVRQAVIDLSLPMLSHPGSKDLLMGYAVLLEIWMLENRLAHLGEEIAIEQDPLYQILGSLADGYGGYLAPLLAALHD